MAINRTWILRVYRRDCGTEPRAFMR